MFSYVWIYCHPPLPCALAHIIYHAGNIGSGIWPKITPVKRTRLNFQCPRFMHQKCLGPKTCFVRVKMGDTVPLPQEANRPSVCEICVPTGIRAVGEPLRWGAIPPGYSMALAHSVTAITCNYSGDSGLTDWKKKKGKKRKSSRGKEMPTLHNYSANTHLRK